MKQKTFDQDQIPLYQKPQKSFKTISFSIINKMLNASQKIHIAFYFIITIIQTLQLFWFIVHPDYQQYPNSRFMSSIRSILKIFNFHQFAKVDASIGQIILIGGLTFIVLQVIILAIIFYQTKNSKIQNQKLIFLEWIMFYLFNTILLIPLFAISINYLYCTNQSSYHINQTCYDASYIGYCILAVLILLNTVGQKIIYFSLFFDSNPFSIGFLSKNNNNSQFGRFLLKITPIVYFILDHQLSYKNVYLFGNAGLYGAYLFFFKFGSIHDFNQINFYFCYFCQLLLTWFSVNNIILIYLQTQALPGGVLESIGCGVLVSFLLVNIEQAQYQKIFIQVIQSKKIKKQSSQKFFYFLIYKFLHLKAEEQKSQLNTAIFILCQSQQDFKQQFQECQLLQQQIQTQRKLIFFKAIKNLITNYIKNSSNVLFEYIICNILILQSYYSLSFHKSVELSMKKLSLVEELAFYRLRLNKRFQEDLNQIESIQKNNIFKSYKFFNQNMMALQALANQCAINNLQYWQQMQEYNPSIHKVRNLAENYKKYKQKITEVYEKIQQVFPNNKQFRKVYLQFLMYVGVVSNTQLQQAEQKYILAIQNQKSLLKFKKQKQMIELGENEKLVFISMDTSQNNKCNIINCNSQIKNLLNYEKQQILNKNVGKLMPKIFMDFHDGLVTNYIHKKQEIQKNKVQRVVYAFNKQNILVEIGLFTKINYRLNNQNIGLEMIGFLKKIDDGTKSLILIQMNSQLIIGFTQSFQKLIQYGINTNQIAGNQVRLHSIMPKIQVDKLLYQKTQTTNLIFTSKSKLTNFGINQEIKKKVSVQIEEIKQYNEKLKLAYLHIKLLDKKPEQSSNQQQKHLNKQQNIKNQRKVPSIRNFTEEKNTLKKIGTKVSIYQQQESSLDKNSSQLSHGQLNEVNLQQNLALQRKKNQFVQNQNLSMNIKITFVVIITYLIVNILLNVTYDQINRKIIATNKMIRQSIANSYKINYDTSVINLNVQKLMQTQKYYNDQNFTSFQKIIRETVQMSRVNLIDLISKAQYFQSYNSLNFNQVDYFAIQDNTSNQSLKQTETSSLQALSDAYFQYLSQSKSFSLITLNQLTNDYQQYVQQNNFIQTNGRSIFLNIFAAMGTQYEKIGAQIVGVHINIQKIILVSIGISLLIGHFLIYIFINKVNMFNIKTISLCNCTRLWDVRQMRFKILNFLKLNEPSLYRFNSKRISASSLLQLFPNQAILQILKPLNKQTHSISQNKNQNVLKNENSNFEDTVQKQQEKKLIESNSIKNKYKVHLEQKNNILLKLSLIMLLSITFLSIFYGLEYSTYQYHKQLLSFNQESLKLGQLKEYLGDFSYYLYQIILGKDQIIYSQLLKQKLSCFYSIAQEQFNNVVSILINTYSQIQEQMYIVQNLIINQHNNITVLDQKYLLSQKLFSEKANQINDIISTDISILATQIEASLQSKGYLMIFIQLLGILLMSFIIYYCLIIQIIRNSRKSQCMIELIPQWIISRNKEVQQMLCDEK